MNLGFKYPFLEKVLTYSQARDMALRLKAEGKKTVLVSGCFDIVHLGHVQFLKDAKNLGDMLFVSVATDETIFKLKGKNRPVVNMPYRASMLASLLSVDFAVLQEEALVMPERINFEKLLSVIKPDIFAVNNTDKSIEFKTKLVEKYGTKLKIVNVEDTSIISTTEIIKKISSL